MPLNERNNVVRPIIIGLAIFLFVGGVGAVDQGSPIAPNAPVATDSPVSSAPAGSPSPRPATRSPVSRSPVQPTAAPVTTTDAPTQFPSFAPVTPIPTSSPTWIRTPAPSRTLTNAPTPPPPTNAPVLPRTGQPTPSPTFPIPTTSFPTPFPTAEPSQRPPRPGPTSRPTASPLRRPTSAPSTAPSLQLQEYLVSVDMYLDNCEPLGSSSEIDFQRITGDHIYTELLADAGIDWTDLEVGTNVKNQVTVTSGRRRLQGGVLEIIFDTAVSFRLADTDLDVPELVGGAFNTEEHRNVYLQRLQSSGDKAFASISGVRVVINGEEQDLNKQTIAPAAPVTMGGINIFIIIGAAAGGIAILILAGLCFCRSKGGKKVVTVASTKHSAGAMGERVGADIVMDNQDDISTLGDPMYAPGSMMMGSGLERDDTVTASIVSGDWDYARSYGASALPDTRARADTLQSSIAGSITDASSFGGLTKMDNSIFSDDMSFEEQFVEIEERFEVDAPAGKLGMVIDTPSGGVPIVHAIKDSSILATRVVVGDRLISVDDEDTTGLTAMQVSKLISQKAENPSRILTFLRTRARAMSGDGMPQ